MSVKMRQKVEREICTAVVDALLVAGLAITVDNGEEEEIVRSTDREAILKVMFLTDEEHLYVSREGKGAGWVFFVYGNDGWDVINDYTVNLEPFIGEGTPVDLKIKEYED